MLIQGKKSGAFQTRCWFKYWLRKNLTPGENAVVVVVDKQGFDRAVTMCRYLTWVARCNRFHVVGPWHLSSWPLNHFGCSQCTECDINYDPKMDLATDMDCSPLWYTESRLPRLY